ncbi:PREDICTED: uncharacterized protein LOC107343276, partial [Paramuricea clavata]
MDMYIFFDVEATSGNPKDGDIVEIAMKTDPKTCKQERSFQSVKSGITKKRLIDPNINEFKVVYKNMMKWLKNRVQKAREWYKKRDISKDVRPVLCAHGGFKFDFEIFIRNVERYVGYFYEMKYLHLAFADTFLLCQELQQKDLPELQDTARLGMDGLYSLFYAGEKFPDRHRAMGDVNAMSKILGDKLWEHLPQLRILTYKS